MQRPSDGQAMPKRGSSGSYITSAAAPPPHRRRTAAALAQPPGHVIEILDRLTPSRTALNGQRKL